MVDYINLSYQKNNNVVQKNRSDEYENQNILFSKIGYTEYNTEYYQAFIDLFTDKSISVIKQLPGQTIPLHTDTFHVLSSKLNVDPRDCIRILVFLEDWKTGHYFEINDRPILQWKKGDEVIINYGEKHLSGNMGIEPKYTLQITKNKNDYEKIDWCQINTK